MGGGNRRGHHRNKHQNNDPMGSADAGAMDSDLPAEYLSSPLSKEPQAPTVAKTTGGKSEAEIKEEEELQLALALSQSEAEESEKRRKKRENSQFYSSAVGKDNAETAKNSSTEKLKVSDGGDLNPELMRYLQRDYWEQKEKTRADSSAEIHHKLPPTTQEAVVMATAGVSGAKSAEELDEFVTTLRTQVEIFVNRMKSNSSRGRSIANDSSVQTLFMNAMSMHSQLLKHIQEQEDKRVYFEGLQDKLTQVKDARAALDALREEERERRRREAEEAERQRQIQMQQKLDLMRQKKQEYLQYQRQLALQRMQEQEREMQLRQEQAKQLYVQKPVARTATGMAPRMGMMQPPPPQQHQIYPGYNMPPQQQIPPHQQQPYGYDPSMTVPPSYQQQQPMMPPPVEQSTSSAPPAMATTGATPYNMHQMTSALPPLGQTAGVPPTPASAHPIQAASYAPQPPPPMTPNPHHMLPQQQQHQHVPQEQQPMVPQQQPQPQAPVAPAVGAPTPQDPLISFD